MYEGVAEYRGKPLQFRGETEAQSAIVPSLDAMLGIARANEVLRTYPMEMRGYLPPGHREFIESLEARFDAEICGACRSAQPDLGV